MSKHFAAIMLPVLLCGVAVAQQRSQNQKPPETTSGTPGPISSDAPKANLNGSGGDAVAPVDPKTFQIGAGDVLYIEAWREPNYSRQAMVRPDGMITLPQINDVKAEGLTPDRLAAQITQGYADYLVNPLVTVTVVAVNSKTFTITGEIQKTGKYPLYGPTTVFDALNNAGGFRDFANKKKIRIIRDSGKVILKFNWEEVAKGKKLEQNILLLSGDTIIVP